MGGIFSGEQLGWDEASIAAFGALPNVLPLPRMDVPGAAPGPAAADGAAASEPSGDSRAAPATGAPSAGGGGGGGGSALSTASAAPARRCQKADVFKAYTMDNFIKATAAAEVFHATWPGQEETTLAIKVVKSEQSRAAMKNIVHDRWNALAALGGGAARRWGSSPDAVKLPSTREATGGSGASPDGLPQPAGHSACEATGEWGVHVLRVLNDAPRHPGVLRLVDVVRPLSDDDEVVAVTEYMAGGSLLEFATRYGTRGDSAMPEAAARAVVAQLAAALGFVHARGFVHRDVSLETAWVSAREPPVRVVLANFGSAVPVADAERVPAWASRGKFGYCKCAARARKMWHLSLTIPSQRSCLRVAPCSSLPLAAL